MGRLKTYFCNHYPRTDFHELNQDWMISMLYDMINQVENFVEMNAIKYADPLQWDITRQYEKNTIVIDGITGVAYISAKAVPSGINIARRDYWNVVFDLSPFINGASKNFAVSYEPALTYIATVETQQGKWIVWNDKLYRALQTIDVGDAYIVGSNLERMTVEEFFNELDVKLTTLINAEATARANADTTLQNNIDAEATARANADTTLQNNIDAEATARANADTTLQNNIDAEATARANADTTLQNNIDVEATARANADSAINTTIGSLSNLNTPNKTSIVNAINSLVSDAGNRDYVCPEDFGAVGDGVTDDSSAINAAINTGKPVIFKHDYGVAHPIEIGVYDSDYINANGFTLFALSGLNDYVVKLNRLYGCIRDLTIDCNLLTSVTGAMLIYSTSELQSQFYLIDNLYTKNAIVGVQYGDGTTNAQSEFTIHGWRTRSVLKALDLNQPNGMLWVTDSHLDVTPYEWQTEPAGVDKLVVNQRVGTVAFDNCTLESPSAVGRGMILYDAIVTNCIVEIAGENLSIINYYAPVRTELTFENCRFFESTGAYFATVGGGYTDCKLTMNNCKIYGSTGYFMYSTIKTDLVLNNLYTTKSIVGINMNLLQLSNIMSPTIKYNLLATKDYTGAKIVKVDTIFAATCRVVHNNSGLLTATYISGGAVVGSETLLSFNGAGEFYYTFEKAFNCECVQLATSDGAIQCKIFTADNGSGFTAPSLPSYLYPEGSVVADSTGATAGWIVSNGHVVAL